MEITFTHHAEVRLAERFTLTIDEAKELLKSAVQVGGQYGSDYCLLNADHGIAFIMTKPHIVKTVLTSDLLYANLSARFKIAPPPSDIKARVEESRNNNSGGALSKKAARRLYEQKLSGYVEPEVEPEKPKVQLRRKTDTELSKMVDYYLNEFWGSKPSLKEREKVEGRLRQHHGYTDKQICQFWDLYFCSRKDLTTG